MIQRTKFRQILAALRDVLRDAYELARAGERGEPLREALNLSRELLDLANETLAGDPQAGEHARGMALHMGEQLAAVEALLGPRAAGAQRDGSRPQNKSPPKRG